MDNSTVYGLQQEVEYLKQRIHEIESNLDPTQMVSAREIIELSNRLHNVELQLSKMSQMNYNYNPYYNGPNPNYNVDQSSYNTVKTSKEQNKANNKTNKLSELNLGKYVMGILASILVMIAVIGFIGMFWGNIPNIVKIAIIMLLGVILTRFGSDKIINKHLRNGFYTSISSCGLVVIFFGIISGNFVWHLYSDLIVIIGIILWFVFSTRLANKAQSIPFYIVNYIGGLTGIILASSNFGTDITVNEQLILFTISAVIIGISSINVYNKRTKNILPIMTISLSIIINTILLATIMTQENSIWKLNKFSDVASTSYILSLAIIVIATFNSIYSYRTISVNLINSFNHNISLLFIILAVVEVFPNIGDAYSLHSWILTGTVLFEIAVVIVLSNSNAIRVFSDVAIISTLLFGLSFGQSPLEYPAVAPCFLTIAIYRILMHRKNYTKVEASAFIQCYLVSIFYYFLVLSDGVFDSIFNFLLVILPLAFWYSGNIDNMHKNKYKSIRAIGFIFTIIASMNVFASLDIGFEHCATFYIALIIWYKLYFIHKDISNIGNKTFEKVVISILMWISQLVIYLITIGTPETIIKIEVTLLLLAVSTLNIFETVKFKRTKSSIIYVVLCNLNTFVLTDIWGGSDILLLFSMLGITISALFIGIGFKFKHKHLRTLGLITIIIYVLKIVFVDTWNISNSGLNILMIALGGVICFIVSFAYNKLAKIYESSENIESVQHD